MNSPHRSPVAVKFVCRAFVPSIPQVSIGLFFCFVLGLASGFADEAWQTRQLHDQFYAEGAAFGDVDGDGKGDLVSGPFWWKGPAFSKRYQIYDPKPFSIYGYSDNFFSYVHDIDGDGNKDVLVYGFPGKEARLYLNPGRPAKSSSWEMTVIADQISDESPAFEDIVPGGLPEIVSSRDGGYGYYQAGADPLQPWKWFSVSQKGETAARFGHGLGTGDVDGDGDLDLLNRFSWWENPGQGHPESTWAKHAWSEDYGRGGAQIHVSDVDGDGLNDIVSSFNAHGYGLAWFRQTIGKGGKREFVRNDIIGESSAQNPYGVAFSQLHAVALKDIDGDGVKDIVTGKRWYAHNGKDPGGKQEAVLYWFRCERSNGQVRFVPRRIDSDSGVGVDALVEDFNADGRLDIASANKKGVSIHLQTNAMLASAPELWQVPGGRPTDDWADSLSPEAAAKAMQVPEGFKVDLIASEPDLVQPVAMCFDARGRIWVVEAKDYPQRSRGKKGKDRVLILEDTNGDGSFDSKKVFMEGLNLVSGIEIGFGGVWLGAAPYLMFVPDADGDDVPDSEPRILLDGWGYQDTHETLNSFTWGPDGWLYGCHGVFTHSNVGKPGTPEEERQPINAGIWRYHPTRHEFEVFAWGISNPWGLDFDEKGDWFTTACVIPHYYHVIQGARYFRQAGQHFNPHVYDDIKTIADHLHYGDGTFNSMRADGKVDRALQREMAADTSALGGGHAHCGLVIYQADAFPEAYRGDSFFHNLHGHRIVRERHERDGSGYVARHGPDFALARDHSFIGVALAQGPDGALYASDWHDPQTCHHRDWGIWDRTDGRIFRIRYGDYKARTIDLPSLSDVALARSLNDANAFIARQAQRLLQERASAGTLDKRAVERVLAKQTASGQPRTLRLRSLWTQRVCGLIDEAGLRARLKDADPFVRGWAIHFLAESKSELDSETLAAFESLAKEDDSSDVRRYLASALQRAPQAQRWSLANALSSHAEDVHDRNLPLMVWYGFEPLVAEDPSRAIAQASQAKWPLLAEFVDRRAAAFEEGRNALFAHVAEARTAQEFVQRGNRYLAAIGSRTDVERPDAWSAFLEKGKSLNDPQARSMTLRMRARLGDASAFGYWRDTLKDASRLPRLRSEALEILQLGGDPEIGAIAANLLADPKLRQAAISALPNYLNASLAPKLIAALPEFPLDLRNEGINLLASRADTTIGLLTAIKSGKLDPSLVSPALIRQMRSHDDPKIQPLMAAIWGGGESESPDLQREMRRWKFALTPEVLNRANPSYGRHVYRNTCGTCHKLFDEGVALGPDLTGSNRANLDYLLENVLAPNSIIGKAYQLNLITTKDGRVISGMAKSETSDEVVIAMVGGAEARLSKSQIEERKILEQSMMPTGLFDAIPEEDVAALVAYLASPSQVPVSENKGN